MAFSAQTVSFLISDLRTSRRNGNYHFQHNVVFQSVYICGTVTDITKSNNSTKIIFKVEDGTGWINCMCEATEPETVTQINKIANLVLEKRSMNMEYYTANSISRLIETSTLGNIKVGDCVKVLGKMRIFHDMNYIYIQKINKVSRFQERINFMTTLIHLYKTTYLKPATSTNRR